MNQRKTPLSLSAERQRDLRVLNHRVPPSSSITAELSTWARIEHAKVSLALGRQRQRVLR